MAGRRKGVLAQADAARRLAPQMKAAREMEALDVLRQAAAREDARRQRFKRLRGNLRRMQALAEQRRRLAAASRRLGV